MAYFDEASSSWIAEPGINTLKVGSSSVKIKQSAKFELQDEIFNGLQRLDP
ncbi:MAG: hypothetical protein Q7W54_05540 [Bacteroidota bacterium]|nr:hypothetical protein [Bacteroidota bacterium]